MNPLLAAVLLLSTSLAAGGQLLFRHGARGRIELVDFVSWTVVSGLFCYGLSTLLWIWALSRASLVTVYPFTMLTFAFVYLGSALLLKEQMPPQAILGALLIAAGLFAIVQSAAAN
ncbi:EamA family transporter [Sphingobium sp. AN641]|uniref:EamA family transporter n=1 Tax=Sphingobium sp. AN641 TaxID=3133443 RepID=UPI0030C129E4